MLTTATWQQADTLEIVSISDTVNHIMLSPASTVDHAVCQGLWFLSPLGTVHHRGGVTSDCQADQVTPQGD